MPARFSADSRGNGTAGASVQLAETGGGTIPGTEAGDDGAADSVKVRLEEGRQGEVNLHENFNVIDRTPTVTVTDDDDDPNDD